MSSDEAMPDALARDRQLLTCYLSTIIEIANSIATACPPVGDAYRDRLARLPMRLGFDVTPRVLEETHEALKAYLAQYGEEAGDYSRFLRASFDQVTVLVQRATEAIVARYDFQAKFFDHVAEQIHAAAEVDDKAALRELLAQQTVGLRSYARNTKAQSAALIAALEEEVRQLKAAIAETEEVSTVDPVTGSFNRRGFIRQLGWFSRNSDWAILMFEWPDFEAIPERFGRAGAEQVMQRVASRLNVQLRGYDSIARWRDNWFAVIFKSTLSNAHQRSGSLVRSLCDKYEILLEGVQWKVNVKINCNVVERIADEPIDRLVDRLDALCRQAEPELKPVG